MTGNHVVPRLVSVFASVSSLLCPILSATLSASAQEVQTNSQVIDEDYHDTSIPVREMAPVPAPGGASSVCLTPRLDLLHLDGCRNVGPAVAQYALHVLDAALGLGQRRLKITPRSQWMFSHRMSLAGYGQRVHQVTARGETEKPARLRMFNPSERFSRWQQAKQLSALA